MELASITCETRSVEAWGNMRGILDRKSASRRLSFKESPSLGHSRFKKSIRVHGWLTEPPQKSDKFLVLQQEHTVKGFLIKSLLSGRLSFKESPNLGHSRFLRNGCECNLPDTSSWLVDGTITRIRQVFGAAAGAHGRGWTLIFIHIFEYGPSPSLQSSF